MSVENWLKSVSAFANGTGGVLVFGTADDGTVAGAKDMRTAAETIRSKIEECIMPLPRTALKQRQQKDGKKLLLLEVSAGKEPPYFYIDGRKRSAYIRSGKENIPAGIQEQKRMLLKAEGISWDSSVTDFPAKNVVFSELSVCFQEWTGGILKSGDLKEFGLVSDNRLTCAGLLFADHSDRIPAVYPWLRCVRWKGVDKTGGRKSITDRAKYTGNLFTLLNRGIGFIKRNMEMRQKKADSGKAVQPDYPDKAIFEGMVNALAHRDYLIEEREIRIDIYDDRLTISSPGGMPDGSRIQDKPSGDILPSERNPVIAGTFARIGYMAREGAGLQCIRSACLRDLGHNPGKAPVFYSDQGQFTLTLKNLNYKERSSTKAGSRPGIRTKASTPPAKDKVPVDTLNENEKRVLAIIAEQPSISADNISRQSEISKRTVERTMQSLKKKSLITRQGSRRSGIWIVNLPQ